MGLTKKIDCKMYLNFLEKKVFFVFLKKLNINSLATFLSYEIKIIVFFFTDRVAASKFIV